MALITAAELSSIRREVGPKTDEGVFQVVRPGARAASGAGFTRAAESVVATVAGRINYIGQLSFTQRERSGIVRSDADYFVTLEAFTDVRVDDFLREIARGWAAGRRYVQGQLVIPTDPASTLIYVAQTSGTTGSSEPAWPTNAGDTVVDGGVTWQCRGIREMYQVLQVMGPGSFSDFVSKRVACNKRQM